ncbi:MAG: hypothetical protein PUA96_06880 [Bacteroidales bacterium]|nr:hypothetical protein [Bacteroidales bacterium]
MLFGKYWRRTLQHLDRDFYSGNFWLIIWLCAGFLIAGVICCFIAALFPGKEDIQFWKVIALLLDPGAFANEVEGSEKLGVKFFIAIFGAVVFTSFIINVVGNLFARRIEAFSRGRVVYKFEDHILILGSNAMLMNILDALVRHPGNSGRDIVIQTEKNPESLRELIRSQLPEHYTKNIYIIYGSRVIERSLKNLVADKAHSIYILGEDDEQMHDALSIDSYEMLKKICAGAETPKPCYLVIDKLSTEYIFRYRKDSGSGESLQLTVINSMEKSAQRVLVSRYFEPGRMYPALDRDGISADSEKSVHLVIVGFSQMAYAMAATAAQICHFPNFRTKGKRTRITFVMKDIAQEMNFFKGHFASLMNLSYSSYLTIDPERESNHKPEEIKNDSRTKWFNVKYSYPQEKYLAPASGEEEKKGFLDIEWEFIDAGIEDPAVREYITDAALNKDEYLSIAICQNDYDANAAASLYLPEDIYTNDVPVFVYQRRSGAVLKAASDSDRYHNIYPFGMRSDCFDSQMRERIRRGMRISYLYDHAYDFTSMPDDNELEAETNWFSTQYVFQQSNIYAANSIDVKLRSIGIQSPVSYESLPDDDILVLAEVEHNRWNVERLLAGTKAMTYKDRKDLNDRLANPEEKEKAKSEHNKLKKEQFFHKDIAPYDELPQSSKDYDINIARNIIRIIK